MSSVGSFFSYINDARSHEREVCYESTKIRRPSDSLDQFAGGSKKLQDSLVENGPVDRQVNRECRQRSMNRESRAGSSITLQDVSSLCKHLSITLHKQISCPLFPSSHSNAADSVVLFTWPPLSPVLLINLRVVNLKWMAHTWILNAAGTSTAYDITSQTSRTYWGLI